MASIPGDITGRTKVDVVVKTKIANAAAIIGRTRAINDFARKQELYIFPPPLSSTRRAAVDLNPRSQTHATHGGRAGGGDQHPGRAWENGTSNLSVSWGSDIAETATPRSGVIEVRRSGNLLPDPFIDPRFIPDHHEGRLGNDHDSKANVLDVSSFGLRRSKGNKGGLEVKSLSSNGDDGLRSEMCEKQIFPPDDNVANISIYPDTSDLISITKPAASHLKTSLQQARLELENLLNRSKDVEERVRMLSSPTKRGRDGFERTISPYRIRSLSEAQEKEERVSERLAQELLRERAQEKEAVEAAYSLIKIADESWNYQFETMSAEFKQQQDRARQVETDLEGSKLQLKSAEAQLLQYKAILFKRQEEMNDLTQRNEVLEKQLKVAKEEIARMVDFGNRALRAERKLEIEIKRCQELEEILMAERATHAEEMRRHAEERSGANEDAKHLQERTQKLLSQVSWQGDACRMQMVAEQLKTKHAEDLSNELAQEVLACKKQCQEIQHELAALRGSHSRLLSHRVLLREHKLASVGKNDKAAILVSCFMKWKGESLQARRCVQCARILTAMRMQRLKISRRRQTSCTPQDVFTWTLPWSQTSTKLGILSGPSPLIFNGKRLSDPARGIGRRNGSKLSSSLGHRLVVSAFEILVDQVREARLARKRGKEVETLHVKAVVCWLFATTTHMGPEEAATTFRLFSMSGMKSGKGIATSHPGSKSKALMPARSADFRVLRDATFWIWRRSANDLKAKERIVTRARSRKDRLLLTSGWMMLKIFVTAIDSAGAYAKSKDDLASLQYFKHWIMTLFHIDMIDRKWKRLSVFVKGLTFKKRKSYAKTWKSCRSMAQEAAVMRCSRVHFANFRGSLLLRLAFMDWVHAALSKHLKFLKCLVSSAVMCRRNQIVDGMRDLVGLQGTVSTDNPAHFLCKRMVFVQWLAITAKLRRTRKKSRIVEHRTWKKVLGCFLQCWCNVMRLRLLSRCRLLTKTMQHLLDWRHSVRFIPIFHSAKMTGRLRAAWTYWAECGSSERLRKALLLSFAAMSMRISSCSTSPGREKCLERTSLTSRQIYTRASCKAAKRLSVLCVALKLLQAEFFALWACKIFADCRDTVRVETVFQKMSSWLTCIQERRCYVVRVYQHRRNRIPKLQAFLAWQHTSWTLKRFSVVYTKISSRVILRSRTTHFRGWKQYITSILSEVCLRKGLIQLEMKRRTFALLRVSCTRGVDFIWQGDSHGRGDSSTFVGRLPSWTTDATDSDWNMSAMSTPTPRSTRSGRSSPIRSGMSSPARLSFCERQLQTGDAELQDIEEDRIMQGSWQNLMGEGLIVDRFTRRVFEGVRAYFTEWKKRTTMQLARTKKISRLAKSMHAKSKKVRRIRLSKMWFKVHFQHGSTLKEKVEGIQKQANNNRKKEFMFVWRQFQMWLHQKRESVVAAYGESAKNIRALFLHLWYTCILHISDQRKRALQIITRRASCRFARTYFEKWTTKALMQIKARCVVQRLKTSPLILKMYRWREAVTEKKILKRKALKLVNLICMRECVLYFQRWCEHRANIIRNKSSAKRVITRILHFALHSAFACWRNETAEKKVTELRSNKIVQQIFKAALVNSFTIWLDLTRENTRLLMAACRVVEISVEKKLRRGVRAFQRIVVYAKCKAHDLYLRTSGLSSRVIWAWTRHAGMVKLRERCLCLGSAFARSELTQRCFRAWKLKACNSRRLEQKMNVEMSCKIISISLRAWAQKTRGTLSLRALGRHGVAMVTAKLRLYCLSRTLSRWCMVYTRHVYTKWQQEENHKKAVLDTATLHLHRVTSETARKNAEVNSTALSILSQVCKLQREVKEVVRDSEVSLKASETRCQNSAQAVFLMQQDRDLLRQQLSEAKDQESNSAKHMLHLMQRVNQQVRKEKEEADHARNKAKLLQERVGSLEIYKERLQSTLRSQDTSYSNLLEEANKILEAKSSKQNSSQKPSFVDCTRWLERGENDDNSVTSGGRFSLDAGYAYGDQSIFPWEDAIVSHRSVPSITNTHAPSPLGIKAEFRSRPNSVHGGASPTRDKTVRIGPTEEREAVQLAASPAASLLAARRRSRERDDASGHFSQSSRLISREREVSGEPSNKAPWHRLD